MKQRAFGKLGKRKSEAVSGGFRVSETVFNSGLSCMKRLISALPTNRKSLVRTLYLVLSGELAKPLRQSHSKESSTKT